MKLQSPRSAVRRSPHLAAVAIALILVGCPDDADTTEDPAADAGDVSVLDVDEDATAPDTNAPDTADDTSEDTGPDDAGADIGPGDVADTPDVDMPELPPVPDVDETVPETADTADVEPDTTLFPSESACAPCVDDDDCDGHCVTVGDGRFCVDACDTDCPEGYACDSVSTGDGELSVCLPESGACTCSDAAIAAGKTGTCFNTNDVGTCSGTWSCTADGLSTCTAPAAAPEVCGGGDEDCDGQVDEEDASGCTLLYADQDMDGFGNPDLTACLCAPEGFYTVVKAGDCADGDDTVAPDKVEVCNGKDDDCDGETDPETASECVPWYLDGDKDGWGVQEVSICACGPSGDYAADKPGDCDDGNGDINPDQPCGPPLCSFFVLSGGCPPGDCDVENPPSPCPMGLTCLDDSQCRSTCSQDTHCQPGLYCAEGACIPLVADGGACGADNQCASDHCSQGYCCVDGLCCDGDDATCSNDNPCTTATCGANFVCQTQNVEGTCAEAGCDGMTFTTAGVCVDGECSADTEDCGGTNPCLAYACDPVAGCQSTPLEDGASCGELSCVGFELTQAKSCDGAGNCSGGGAQIACPGGFTCAANGTTCATSCASSSDCQPDAWCSDGVCLEKKLAGAPCNDAEQCHTGNCSGGFCCDGCCDTGTLGTMQLPRAMEICGETDYGFQGKNNCARVISEFGNFEHDDHAPGLGDTAMVQLSTGVAHQIGEQQEGENQNTSGQDPDGTVNQAFDLCGFTVTLDVPPDAQGFAFDFIFFSSEYPEWVGTQYNDTFNAMLTASNYDNENVAFDNGGNPISINVAFFTICNGPGCAQPDSLLQGTGYDDNVGGATGWLTTTVPVVAGESITLRFVIYDEGDHIYDSDVLINNFRWLQVVSGTGPVTE